MSAIRLGVQHLYPFGDAVSFPVLLHRSDDVRGGAAADVEARQRDRGRGSDYKYRVSAAFLTVPLVTVPLGTTVR